MDSKASVATPFFEAPQVDMKDPMETSSSSTASTSLPMSSNLSSRGSATPSMSPYPLTPRQPRNTKQGLQVKAREPYSHPVDKHFRGSQSHIKYMYYFTFGDRLLKTPPPIPHGVQIPIGSVFVLKKQAKDSIKKQAGDSSKKRAGDSSKKRGGDSTPKVLQSWLRVAEAGREKWIPLQVQHEYRFPHGDYVYSIDKSTPSWATARSKQKLESDTRKRMAIAEEGTGKRKRAVDSEEEEEEESPSRRVSLRRHKRVAM
ncbi:hypothetical protein NMY22_g17067 [Coprinellus aureogranulatus]|nr:hypothetical protein NMY22_g17067 [Coprinellus aureogranulatus]